MTVQPTTGKKKWYRKARWIAGGLLSLFFACLIPEVLVGLVVIAGLITIGWAFFLIRVGPQIELDPTGISIAVASLVLLIVGIDRFVRSRRPTWKFTQTVRCVVGIVGVFLSGICLVGLGHELTWMNRSTTPWFRLQSSWDESLFPRQVSKIQMKQLGLAVREYYNRYESLPVGGVFKRDGAAGHGWITSLLPYLDQADLYKRVHFGLPWYHRDNRAVFETLIPPLNDPRRKAMPIRPNGYAPTFYAANDQIVNANRTMKLRQMTDGLSNTVLAGEVSAKIRPWGDVVNWRSFDLGINQSPDGFGGLWKGGMIVLLADGSVMYLSEKTDPKTLRAMATPDAHDVVGDPNLED